MAIGKGVLKAARVGKPTSIVRAQASNPLKLLCPLITDAAWAYTTTFGGGLVAGDRIDLDVELADATSCVRTTQASTKVYKSPHGRVATQNTHATVGQDALLVVAPDPITCFADANYQQDLTLNVADGGNLVLVDWLTSGRRARSECWDFSRYLSHIRVDYGGDCVFLDSLLLDPSDGDLKSPFRLGHFHCMALLLMVGPFCKQQSTAIIEEISHLPVEPGSSLIQAASEISCGMILRILGTTTEQVGRILQHRLEFVSGRIGNGPWSRKW